jgi:hypothetical protein
MRRRALLAATGSAATVLTAGCLDGVGDRPDGSVRLGWFAAHNPDTEPHRFELLVERDGDRVHRSDHRIPAREGNVVHSAVADCDWGPTPGSFTVIARVDGGTRVEESVNRVDTAGGREVDCAIAEAEYRDGKLRVAARAGCDQGYDGTCPFVGRN